MKTKEELNVIKKEVEALNEKLTELSEKPAKKSTAILFYYTLSE